MNYWYIKDLSGTPLFFYWNTYTKNSATHFSPLSLLFFNRWNRCCKKTSIELFIAIRTRVLIPMIQSKFLWKQNSKFSQTFHIFMNQENLSNFFCVFSEHMKSKCENRMKIKINITMWIETIQEKLTILNCTEKRRQTCCRQKTYNRCFKKEKPSACKHLKSSSDHLITHITCVIFFLKI